MFDLPKLWTSLLEHPEVLAACIGAIALVVGVVLTFTLSQWGMGRTTRKERRDARRRKRAGQRFLTKLANGPRRVIGEPRWSLAFNSSLSAYEIEQHGPGDTYNVRVDFFAINVPTQTELAPTVQVAQLPPGIPLTMRLGAPSLARQYGVAIRWDDDLAAEQIEKLLLRDAAVI